MRKPIAIALRENAFYLALTSAKNFGSTAIEFMYGTPERARMTFWFAIALVLMGAALNASEVSAMQVCPA